MSAQKINPPENCTTELDLLTSYTPMIKYGFFSVCVSIFFFFAQNHTLLFWNGSLAEEFAIAFWSLLCHQGNGCRALSPSFPFHSSSLCSSHLPLISSLILRLVLVVTSMEVACNLLLLSLDINIVNHRVGKDVEPNVFGVRN